MMGSIHIWACIIWFKKKKNQKYCPKELMNIHMDLYNASIIFKNLFIIFS
jgi:hypothetical protein